MQNNHTLSDFAQHLHSWMQWSVGIQGVTEQGQTFDQLAMELFRLQFDCNAAYRRICQARNVSPETLASCVDIPAVHVSAFKEIELSSIDPAERTTVFRSSGTTTQIPSRHFHSPESLRIYESALMLWFEKCFLQRAAEEQQTDLKLLFLTPALEAAPHSSLVYMFETIRRKHAATGFLFAGRTQSDGGWTVAFASALEWLEAAIATGSPVAVLGTAFSFVHFLDELSNTGKRLRLPAGSSVLETGGYKGRSRSMAKEELHAWIREMLGVAGLQIVSEYGMSELSSQGYEERADSAARRVFRFPPWARVQLISPETGHEVQEGEIGLIRVFDLANVYPVATLQTEDLGIRRGDGFELIGRATASEPRGCSLMSKE